MHFRLFFYVIFEGFLKLKRVCRYFDNFSTKILIDEKSFAIATLLARLNRQADGGHRNRLTMTIEETTIKSAKLS